MCCHQLIQSWKKIKNGADIVHFEFMDLENLSTQMKTQCNWSINKVIVGFFKKAVHGLGEGSKVPALKTSGPVFEPQNPSIEKPCVMVYTYNPRRQKQEDL